MSSCRPELVVIGSSTNVQSYVYRRLSHCLRWRLPQACVFDLFRPHFLPPWNTFSSHLRRLFQTPGIYGHSQNPSGVSSLDLGYPKPLPNLPGCVKPTVQQQASWTWSWKHQMSNINGEPVSVERIMEPKALLRDRDGRKQSLCVDVCRINWQHWTATLTITIDGQNHVPVFKHCKELHIHQTNVFIIVFIIIWWLNFLQIWYHLETTPHVQTHLVANRKRRWLGRSCRCLNRFTWVWALKIKCFTVSSFHHSQTCQTRNWIPRTQLGCPFFFSSPNCRASLPLAMPHTVMRWVVFFFFQLGHGIRLLDQISLNLCQWWILNTHLKGSVNIRETSHLAKSQKENVPGKKSSYYNKLTPKPLGG